jgi:Ca2+-binding RTX toxin-like protein
MEWLLLLGGLLGLSAWMDRDQADDDGPTPDPRPEPQTNRIEGTAAGDYITATPSNDAIFGYGGGDFMYGYGEDDVIYGGNGDDYAFGGSGNDSIYGGAGDDVIETGSSSLFAEPSDNIAEGGVGDDRITAYSGGLVTGGEGNDAISIFHRDGLTEPTIITDFNPTDDSLLIDLQDVGASNDRSLQLSAWEDGTGADLYFGDELLAKITGGQGLSVEDITITVHLTEENDGESQFTDGDSPSIVLGNGNDNEIYGAGGDDSLFGHGTPALYGTPELAGEDALYGGAGIDMLVGNGGTFPYGGDSEQGPIPRPDDQIIARDSLFGGEGNDLLISVNGNDMTGGDGSDVFAISQLTDPLFSPEVNVITDYDPTLDEIVVDADSILAGEALSISVWANGQGANILAGSRVIAEVAGGQSLIVGDIRLVDDFLELERAA